MNISTNSWHYKMNKFVHGRLRVGVDVSTSLCGYFWQTVFSPIIVITFVLVGLLTITCMAWVFLYVIGGLFSTVLVVFDILPESYILKPTSYNLAFIPMSIIADILLVGVFHVSFIYKSYKERKIQESLEKNKPIDSKPLLVIEYIKAKKRKICPLINFTKN